MAMMNHFMFMRNTYNLDGMKNQKLKVTLGVFSGFGIGVAVPLCAVAFQQRKTASA